jgi:lipopolysaccharide transport system permease protein
MIFCQFLVPRRVPGTLFLRNLVERRSLLFQLVRRDFEQRFVGSAIGWVWALIQPLVLLVSWTYIFRVCLKMQLGSDAVTSDFPLFVFSGMLPWILFSETVLRSASSVVEHANLITKTVFPAEIVPVAVFLSTLVSHFLALALMLGAIALRLHSVGVFVFLLPLFMLGTGLFAIGLGWIVAGLHVYLRDTAQLMGVILTFWFWLTPIMITENQVPAGLQFLLKLNPMRYAVRGYRLLLFTSHPAAAAHDFLILLVCGAGVFLLGGLFFRQMKRGFADVL